MTERTEEKLISTTIDKEVYCNKDGDCPFGKTKMGEYCFACYHRKTRTIETTEVLKDKPIVEPEGI